MLVSLFTSLPCLHVYTFASCLIAVWLFACFLFFLSVCTFFGRGVAFVYFFQSVACLQATELGDCLLASHGLLLHSFSFFRLANSHVCDFILFCFWFSLGYFILLFVCLPGCCCFFTGIHTGHHVRVDEKEEQKEDNKKRTGKERFDY